MSHRSVALDLVPRNESWVIANQLDRGSQQDPWFQLQIAGTLNRRKHFLILHLSIISGFRPSSLPFAQSSRDIARHLRESAKADANFRGLTSAQRVAREPLGVPVQS